MKFIDILLCPILILILFPIILLVGLIVYMEDKNSPFYISKRVGKDGKPFSLYKFRSMVLNPNPTVDSTSNNDLRITKVGRFIRRHKLDELPQLFNVMFGDMSLVGPRPNVQREVNQYTKAEMRLLEVKPGMTDFCSVIFSDLGIILAKHCDADLAYNQLVRHWKGQYGLFYVQKRTFLIDLVILFLTAVVLVSRDTALKLTHTYLKKIGAPNEIVEMSLRRTILVPLPPLGATQIVINREL
jgi:lipopolysaccharide/colanic/teichoic acid biosynthesis glycosyltransferase